MAQRTGKPVQVLGLSGEKRDVVASADGLITETLSETPFQVRQGKKFVPVDTRLVQRGDGTWGPATGAVNSTVSGGGDSILFRVFRAGREFSLTTSASLPAPTVSGDTATYPNAVDKDIDLAVRVLPDGISHFVVVRTAEAAQSPKLAELQLRLGGSNVKVTTADDGGVRVNDESSGNGLFEAEPPEMWDAGQPSPGEGLRAAPRRDTELLAGPNDNSKTARVRTSIRSGFLVLKPDSKLLTSTGVHYPVVIDPVFTTVGPDAAGYGYASISSPGGLDTSWSTSGVGFCSDAGVNMSDCDDGIKRRILYRFPTGVFKGQNIISAAFQVKQTSNYDGALTEVALWATKNYNSSTTWSSQDSMGSGKFWDHQLDTRKTNFGSAAASANTVRFDAAAVRNYVHEQSTSGASTVVFGLRTDESTYRNWKRFERKAFLQVQYNLPPRQPAQAFLTTDGGPCQAIDSPLIVNKVPILRAGLTDPNVAERLQGEIELQYIDPNVQFGSPEGGWKTNVATENDNINDPTRYEFNMSQATPEANKQIRWRVRAHDFRRDAQGGITADWQGVSPWSDVDNPDYPAEEHWCNFVIDTQAPKQPQITSKGNIYPEYPSNTLWNGGVGVQETFRLAPAAGSATWDFPKSYSVTFSDWSAPRSVNAAADGSAEINVSPTTGGEKVLVVTAKDGANRLSQSRYYRFRVKEQPPAAAYWKLDGSATSQKLLDDQGNEEFTANIQGADVAVGVQGKRGTAIRLNSDSDTATVGYAETDKPVIDPSASYSISAWVKINKVGGWSTVLAQDGAVMSPFYLQYDFQDKRWALTLADADVQNSPGVRALSKEPPQIGKWTHLVGVYDATAQTSSLYVDGKLQQTVTFTQNQWKTGSAGSFTIGRARHNSQKVDFFPGEIDQVKALTRAVSAAEAEDLFYGAVSARWRLDVASGGATADDTGVYGLSVGGNAKTVSSDLCADRMIGAGCLSVPLSGYAATGGPVVDTDRSFTIAGWALPAGIPNSDSAVFSQAGSVNSAFSVRYSPSAYNGIGGWQIVMPDKDSADAAWATVEHDVCGFCLNSSQADHLALVYSAPEHKLSLYVNGLLSASAISTRDNVKTFNATGALQLGRAKKNGAFGDFFSGLIDDVWAYQGALSEDRIGQLSNGADLDITHAP
ncbi:LamG domain-containing protein [Spirillospora sp. NPDC049652]